MVQTRQSTQKATKSSRKAAKARNSAGKARKAPESRVSTQALNGAPVRTMNPEPPLGEQEQETLQFAIQQVVERHSGALGELLARGQTSQTDLQAFLDSLLQGQAGRGLYGTLLAQIREQDQMIHRLLETANELMNGSMHLMVLTTFRRRENEELQRRNQLLEEHLEQIQEQVDDIIDRNQR